MYVRVNKSSSDKKPFIYTDGKMQVRFLWRPEAAHAIDWAYAMITTSCPSANSSMILYEADAWSNVIVTFSDTLALQWLDQIRGDGVSHNAMYVSVADKQFRTKLNNYSVVPAHGQPTPLADIVNALGYEYPPYNSHSFTTGGNICLKNTTAWK